MSADGVMTELLLLGGFAVQPTATIVCFLVMQDQAFKSPTGLARDDPVFSGHHTIN